jgi:hypothetical protein
MPYVAMADPMRLMPRKLSEDPSRTKSSTLTVELNRVLPKTDKEDPSRAKCRILKLLPRIKKSRTDIEEPKRDSPTVETEELMRTY